jgi:hypothetical protein
MDTIESLGFRLRKVQHARSHDAKPCAFEASINLADEIAAYAIRLDDGKSALNAHDQTLQSV